METEHINPDNLRKAMLFINQEWLTVPKMIITRVENNISVEENRRERERKKGGRILHSASGLHRVANLPQLWVLLKGSPQGRDSIVTSYQNCTYLTLMNLLHCLIFTNGDKSALEMNPMS